MRNRLLALDSQRNLYRFFFNKPFLSLPPGKKIIHISSTLHVLISLTLLYLFLQHPPASAAQQPNKPSINCSDWLHPVTEATKEPEIAQPQLQPDPQQSAMPPYTPVHPTQLPPIEILEVINHSDGQHKIIQPKLTSLKSHPFQLKTGWGSVYFLDHFAPCGDPLWSFFILGPNQAANFDIRWGNPQYTQLIVPNAETLNKKINEVNERLATHGFQPIPIHFTSEQKRVEQYVRDFIEKSTLPLSDHHYLHDFSYHFSSVLLPNEFMAPLRLRGQLLLRFIEALRKQVQTEAEKANITQAVNSDVREFKNFNLSAQHAEYVIKMLLQMFSRDIDVSTSGVTTVLLTTPILTTNSHNISSSLLGFERVSMIYGHQALQVSWKADALKVWGAHQLFWQEKFDNETAIGWLKILLLHIKENFALLQDAAVPQFVIDGSRLALKKVPKSFFNNLKFFINEQFLRDIDSNYEYFAELKSLRPANESLLQGIERRLNEINLSEIEKY